MVSLYLQKIKDNDAIWRRIVERNLMNPKEKEPYRIYFTPCFWDWEWELLALMYSLLTIRSVTNVGKNFLTFFINRGLPDRCRV